MTVFHSPGCRIVGTKVMQGGRSDQAFSDQSFAVTVTIEVTDQSIWTSLGYENTRHTIFHRGERIAEWVVSTWLGHHPARFANNYWRSRFWPQAKQATSGTSGVFLYKPSVSFDRWGFGGARILTEFAVAEEDHYFSIGG